MKKLSFLTSMVALTFAVPAMAVPSNTSSTFPSDGFMEEDYTYQNQATVTNLKVAEGTATTTAQYSDCDSNYPNSDAGATSTDQCYRACAVSDFPAGSHIATVTGKNYAGANETDTCAIATCDTGYTLNSASINLVSIIGNDGAPNLGYVSNSGRVSQDAYGLSGSDLNAFVVDFGTRGKIKGYGICSTQSGTNNSSTWSDPTVYNSLTPEFGTGGNCYCRLVEYESSAGTSKKLSTPWMFDYDIGSTSGCERDCAASCANDLAEAQDMTRVIAFRTAIFNTVTVSPSCAANEISITWADASAEDIAANDAGTVTYGGDIRTPKKAVHKPGKIFTGWTFNAQ